MNAIFLLWLGLLLVSQNPSLNSISTARTTNRLPQWFQISGKIVDKETREPAKAITVHLLRRKYDEFGIERLVLIQNGATNERGEYQISGVSTSSSLYIAASGSGYRMMFFPGTPEASRAIPVTSLPGQDVRNIDLETYRTRLYKISGRMLDALHVRQPHLSSVTLVRRGFTESSPQFSAYRVAEDGTFEIPDVPSGSYYVVGLRIDDEAHRARPVVAVDVDNADVNDVELIAAEGYEIDGRVRVEGPPISPLNVVLKPVAEPASLLEQPPAVRPDDTFTLAGLPAGEYRLSVLGMPDDFYIKSARFDSVDVLESGMSLRGAVTGKLEVVLSNNGGRIDGRIVDPSRPQAGRFVVLVPEKLRPERADLYKRTTADASGQFTIRGIAPGAYRIFTVDQLDPDTYRDPLFLEQFMSRSHRVFVEAGGLTNIEITRTD